MQLASRHAPIEFNPLRLFVVWKWMIQKKQDNTSSLKLIPGRNANAAVHDDTICRPEFEAPSNRWVQRCICCAHLGTNVENARGVLQLRKRWTMQMEGALSTMVRGLPSSNSAAATIVSNMDKELIKRLELKIDTVSGAERGRNKCRCSEESDDDDVWIVGITPPQIDVIVIRFIVE